MARKDENVRQVTKRGGGQGSRGDQDQPADIEVSITIHEEASTREERLKTLMEEAPVPAAKVKPKIQKPCSSTSRSEATKFRRRRTEVTTRTRRRSRANSSARASSDNNATFT
ncbi:hypothetical protein GBA52_026885 [Prunus armeniaca]|nr:hypothetical protein GBA52_026885 [Prunus armeniaca]